MEKGLSFQQMMLEQWHSQILKENKFLVVNLILYTKNKLRIDGRYKCKTYNYKNFGRQRKRKSMLTLGLVMSLCM